MHLVMQLKESRELQRPNVRFVISHYGNLKQPQNNVAATERLQGSSV